MTEDNTENGEYEPVAERTAVELTHTDWLRVATAANNGKEDFEDETEREHMGVLVDEIIDQAPVTIAEAMSLEIELRARNDDIPDSH